MERWEDAKKYFLIYLPNVEEYKSTLLTAERTNLSEETIKGLRRAKEHCREMKGAHNVDTREKKVLTAMQSAHSVYEQRKEEEKKKNELKKRLEADKLEEQKRQQEQLKKVNKKKTSLDQKEGKLKEDEKKTNENYNVASRAFDDATTSLQIAIANNDMTGIRVVKDLLDSAKKEV